MGPQDEIDLSEELGRSVGFESKAKKAKRSRPHRELFEPPKGSTDRSVDRLSADGDCLQTIARDRHEKREETFYGWGVVTAAAAVNNYRRVHASPCPSNPFHADIIFPEQILNDPKLLRQLTQELADRSFWRDSSPPLLDD